MLGRYRLRVQLEQTSVDTEVVQVLLGLEMNKHMWIGVTQISLVLFHLRVNLIHGRRQSIC